MSNTVNRKRTSKTIAAIREHLGRRIRKNNTASHTKIFPADYRPVYKSPEKLNKCRLLLDAVGEETLRKVVNDYLTLLDTSASVYEKTGEYAIGITTSAWCRLLATASFRLCETEDVGEALASGKWLCHESCWHDAAKKAIADKQPVDTACVGGLRVHAVPILADQSVVGAINFGYGAPPTTPAKLKALARQFDLPYARLAQAARAYRRRPDHFVDMAKRQSHSAANLIGAIVGRKKAEDALQKSEQRFRSIFEQVNIGMAQVMSRTGRFLRVNQKFSEILGYSQTDLTDMTYVQITHPDDVPQDRELMRLLLTRQIRRFRRKKRFFHKNGSVVWVQLSISPLWAEGEAPTTHVTVMEDISERIQAQEALAESERRFRALMEQSPVSLEIYRPDGLLLQANPAWERLWGVKAPNFVRRFNIMHHPGIKKTPQFASIQKAFNGEAVFIAEDVFDLKLDAAPRFKRILRTHLYPIKNTQNKIANVVIAHEDITTQKKMAAALRSSQANYQELFNAEPDAIIIVDAGTMQIIEANRSAARLYGYTATEIRALQAPQLSAEPDKSIAHIQSVHLRKNTPGTAGAVRRMHLKKDGTVFPVEITTGTYTLENRDLICAIIRDISQRHTAQTALAAEKERLATTLRSIGEGVIATDATGRITILNAAAENLTAWRQEQAIGRPVEEVLHIIDKTTGERRNNPVQQVLQGAGSIRLDRNTNMISRTGHACAIATVGAPILNAANETIGAVLVFRDITVKRRMARELAKIQKLESLGVLAGGIAHDFNNFLTAIIGHVSLARWDAQDGKNINGCLAQIENASQRAKALTQQLLTFARGGEPVKTLVDIGQIIKDTVKFALSGTNVNCRYDLAPNLKPIEIDRGQIEQVLNNLIINATQAMPAGGEIRIIARNHTLTMDNPYLLEPGIYLYLKIADTGSGIASEHIGKVFDPYFSTKTQGSGLGLTVAYAIIEKHKGRITIESEQRTGTSLHIFLPTGKRAPQTAAPPHEKGKPTGRNRILIMDDEDYIREIATKMLTRLGYRVTTACHGEQALELYRQAMVSEKKFDAVITDLTVPGGMGGKETIRGLRQIDPDAVVLVSSGYSQDPIMADYRRYGFKGVIQKPYSLDEIDRVLKESLLIERLHG